MHALRRLLRAPGALQARVESFNASLPGTGHGLAKLLESLAARGSARCPVCGTAGNKVIARFPDRTYRRCGGAGPSYLESFAGGREVLRQAILLFGVQRAVRAHLPGGFRFDKGGLAATRADHPSSCCGTQIGRRCGGHRVRIRAVPGRAEGIRDCPAIGVDVSPGAVTYVRKNLGHSRRLRGIRDMGRNRFPRRISAVTLWYVIEHFRGHGSSPRARPLRSCRRAVCSLSPRRTEEGSPPVGICMTFS